MGRSPRDLRDIWSTPWTKGLESAVKGETMTRVHMGPALHELGRFLNTSVSPFPCL